MQKFEFPLGKNGGKAEFLYSEGENLSLTVTSNGESYQLSFQDGIFLDRKYHDCNQYKSHNFTNFFHNAAIKAEKNTIEFTSLPFDKNSGKIENNITTVNRFTILEESAQIVQELFFVLKKTIYDCSFYTGRFKIDYDSFDEIGNELKDVFIPVENLSTAFQKELILKGNGRYIKITGGTVMFEKGGVIDSHAEGTRYNDDLSYYDKNNPIYTVYSFEEAPLPVLPESNMKQSLSGESLMSIECGRFNTKIAYDNHTLALWNIEKKTALISMLLRNVSTGEEVFIDTLTPWESVSVSNDKDVCIILKTPSNIEGIEVSVTGEKYPLQNRIEWSVSVKNDSPLYSLLWCTYPRFLFNTDKICDLFVPSYGGNVNKDFTLSDSYTGGSYPSGFWYTMPYYALFGSGNDKSNSVYFAIHDSTGAIKDIYVSSDRNGIVRFVSRCFAENWGKPKNTYTLPGKAVWQIFDGDWYDATNIYREYVNSECFWAEENKDKKTPEWMDDIPFWIMDWIPYDPESGEILPTNLRTDSDVIGENDWYEKPVKFQEAVGVPIGYHIYNWHQIPFNNDYPHFMPPRKRFMDGFKELKKHDIRVMPYINALLWDTKDRGNEDFEFETYGRPGAVKKENGDVETLSYESRESDGQLVKLAPMCPSSRVWKDKILKLTDEMFRECGVDAIYLDQIAARVPHPCMDETHGHPLAGGSWWNEEYNKLLAELNAQKPDGKAFTTECNAEVYTKNMDAFLSWCWNKTEDDVPAFMRLYSDKVQVFGRNTNGYLKGNDWHWKYNLAQELVCGQQLGWVNADFVDNKKRLEFTKKLIRFRYANKEFFRYPEVLRPPVADAQNGNKFVSRIGMGYPQLLIKPYLCTGTLSDGEKKMMIIVNINTEDVTDTIRWNGAEYDFTPDSFTVSGDGKVAFAKEDCMEVTVEKESLICITWK